MTPTVLNLNKTTNHLPNLFFDEQGAVGIQRYDKIKYPVLEKLYKKQRSFYWIPEEIGLSKDINDFKNLTENEKHVFTSNIKRQIVLDSFQGRAPTMCFGPIVSNPTMEKILNIWTFFETIHSESYTHIIKNVYPDPSKVFDEMMDIKEIVDCGVDVSKYHNDLLESFEKYSYGSIEQKRAAYLAMVSTNALEQIRFQVSFACTFSFGQRDLMDKSSLIVKLIRQDESVHCGFSQNALKFMVKEDDDFARISEDHKDEVKHIYDEVYKQELEWIDYLFQYGPIYGLTKEELTQYLGWLSYRRFRSFGVDFDFDAPKKDPLPWMSKWINTDDDQPPPQEDELTSYQLGTVDFDMKDGDFDEFDI